jgi:hypothetical protein
VIIAANRSRRRAVVRELLDCKLGKHYVTVVFMGNLGNICSTVVIFVDIYVYPKAIDIYSFGSRVSVPSW